MVHIWWKYDLVQFTFNKGHGMFLIAPGVDVGKSCSCQVTLARLARAFMKLSIW